MTVPPIMQAIQDKRTAAEIFESHGLAMPFDASELVLTGVGVYEPSYSREVSNQVLDGMFPREGALEAWHFTTQSTLQEILRCGELWLASITKRLDEGEYEVFAREHGFASANDTTQRTDLARNYFYTSFSPIGSGAEDRHWQIFGRGEGVRLRFKLSPQTAELRRIVYHQDSNPSILASLNKELSTRIGRVFTPWSVARVSAFRLPEDLSYEDEIRLLVGNPPEQGRPVIDGHEYFRLPIDTMNEWCNVHLREIACDRSVDRAAVEDLVQHSTFKNVPVTGRTP